MLKTDSFLGNKKLSPNQNVWRDHATMQQDVFGGLRWEVTPVMTPQIDDSGCKLLVKS